jgi:hypothetical protein
MPSSGSAKKQGYCIFRYAIFIYPFKSTNIFVMLYYGLFLMFVKKSIFKELGVETVCLLYEYIERLVIYL